MLRKFVAGTCTTTQGKLKTARPEEIVFQVWFIGESLIHSIELFASETLKPILRDKDGLRKHFNSNVCIYLIWAVILIVLFFVSSFAFLFQMTNTFSTKPKRLLLQFWQVGFSYRTVFYHMTENV